MGSQKTYCTNCYQEIERDTKFCPHCGTVVKYRPPAQEGSVCHNCGNENVTDARFCRKCGSTLIGKMDDVSPKGVFGNKGSGMKKPKFSAKKKTGIVVGILAVIAVVVAGIFIIPMFIGSKTYGLYVKDSEMYGMNMKNNEEIQITSNLWNHSDGSADVLGTTSPMSVSELLGESVTFFDNGKKMLFADKLEGSYGRTIYYTDLTDKDGNSTKIDSDIAWYEMDEKGENLVYYCTDGGLYTHDLTSKTRIASNVRDSDISKDFSKIIYIDEELDVYLYEDGVSEKIVSGITGNLFTSDDFSVMYYTKNDSLYRQESSGDKEKIESDILSLLQMDENNGAYYLLMNEDIVEEYNTRVYDLFYYDGTQSNLIAEGLTSASLRGDEEANVIAFEVVDEAELKKGEWVTKVMFYTAGNTMLTDCTSLSYVEISKDGSVIHYMENISDEYVGDLYCSTIKDGIMSTPILYDFDVYYISFALSESNQEIYLKEPDEFGYGDLYIDGRFVDDDVRGYDITEFGDAILYFSDWEDNDRCGTLMQYENGEKSIIAEEVADVTVLTDELLLYMDDFNTKYCEGTVYSYDKEEHVRIAEDVSSLVRVVQKD